MQCMCSASRTEEPRVANVAKNATTLRKTMLNEAGPALPDFIVYLEQAAINPAEMRVKKQDKSITDTIAAAYYKEKEAQDDQMERHKKGENVNDNELKTYWRHTFNIWTVRRSLQRNFGQAG